VAGDDAKWKRYLGDAVAAFEATGELLRGDNHPRGWRLGVQRFALRGCKPWLTAERQALVGAYLPGRRESPKPYPRSTESLGAWAQCEVPVRREPAKGGDAL